MEGEEDDSNSTAEGLGPLKEEQEREEERGGWEGGEGGGGLRKWFSAVGRREKGRGERRPAIIVGFPVMMMRRREKRG